ncbi:MFS transporter [Occultella glacieicola]|uniref:MFS transporter n=1 Tax=Occultella glacieicola TaxID=2518684 RepID=A0ABY2E3B0_9MICO|nr:MFS transporter [Occultella glacieicola]TDE93902.1 MFS transporter [Occultella glacieicola]
MSTRPPEEPGTAAGSAGPDAGSVAGPDPGVPDDVAAKPRWRRDATIFLSGQTVTLFGSMLVQYAIMWHLTLETKSGSVMALASVFGFLPQAIVSIFGGVWADRLDRKRLIMAADGTIAVTTLALAILMLAGTDHLWLFYGTLAIRSIGAGIQLPAVSALIPQLVPTSKLMRVNGLNGTIQSAMMLVAPAAAAAVYANFSIVAIFFVDVTTAAIGIGLLVVLSVPRIVRRDVDGPLPGYFDDLVGGVRYVGRHPFIRWVLLLFGVVFLLVAAPSYLTPLLIVRTFGEEVWKLTANELAFSIGMTLGGALIAAWGGLRNRILMMLGSVFVFGGLTAALGLAPNLWVFLALMFGIGLFVPLFSTPSFTVLQETVEPERQGRVFGFVGLVMAVSMPLGMAVFGPLADLYSVEVLMIAAGVLLIAAAAVALLVPAGRRTMLAAGDLSRREGRRPGR